MKREEKLNGAENEYLFVWCKEHEKKSHHDFYVFGHRHLVLELKVGENSAYYNLGEWVHQPTYGVYDGSRFMLKPFVS